MIHTSASVPHTSFTSVNISESVFYINMSHCDHKLNYTIRNMLRWRWCGGTQILLPNLTLIYPTWISVGNVFMHIQWWYMTTQILSFQVSYFLLPYLQALMQWGQTILSIKPTCERVQQGSQTPIPQSGPQLHVKIIM